MRVMVSNELAVRAGSTVRIVATLSRAYLEEFKFAKLGVFSSENGAEFSPYVPVAKIEAANLCDDPVPLTPMRMRTAEPVHVTEFTADVDMTIALMQDIDIKGDQTATARIYAYDRTDFGIRWLCTHARRACRRGYDALHGSARRHLLF